MSRSPYTVSASVRGIGVAVITSTCGVPPFSRSAARCSTPKRCCSSTTDEPQARELHVPLDQRVRPDGDIDVAARDRVADRRLLRRLQAAPQQRDVDRPVEVRRPQRHDIPGPVSWNQTPPTPVARGSSPDCLVPSSCVPAPRRATHERLEMLLREDLRRRHDRALVSVRHRRQQRRRRDHRLPASNVPLEQPRHRHAARNLRENRIDRPPLGRGEGEGQRGREAVAHSIRQRELRRRPARLPLPPPLHDPQLHRQQLFEREAAAGPISSLDRVREVHLPDRLRRWGHLQPRPASRRAGRPATSSRRQRART